MLDLIPQEILVAIAYQVTFNRDRQSLSQVSKKLYALVLPILYESITIKSSDESNLDQTNVEKYVRPYFSYARKLSFVAPFEKEDIFRCIHWKLLREADKHDVDYDDQRLVSKVDELGELMSQIRPVFQGLQDNHLRIFHWNLGTCIPKEILGPGGYLPTRQKAIEDLSLVTSDPCILPKSSWEYHICLTEFKSLKKLSWSGGLSREFFDSLRDVLSINSKHLEALAIDLMDWWDAQWNWCDDDGELQHWIKSHNFFTERVLELALGETNVRFPSLRSLSLSFLRLEDASFEISHAFDITRLRALNLRNCSNAGSLLSKWVDSGNPIKLSSLELVVQSRSIEDDDDGRIISFISSFKGLTSLHLLISAKEGVTGDRYWPCIYHHRSTLTRLIYHERFHDFSWVDHNFDIECHRAIELFTLISPECAGLCLTYKIPMGEAFSQLTKAQLSNLKLLCLRGTGARPDFFRSAASRDDGQDTIHNFIVWAFVTFPNLLFIASGDFSHGSKYASYHKILYRYPFPGVDSDGDVDNRETTASQNKYEAGFRELKGGDWGVLSHLEQFREVLEACPAEPLFQKDF